MVYLKQSTAATLLIGPFVDSTDGNTAETGLTIAQADVRLSKNGGNMAQKNDATSCTHDELGYYTCPLDATDTNTLGILKVMVHESGALPVWVECMVVTANWYDTMFSTDQLDVNVTNIEGSDATNQINAACDTALTDYDAATGTELAAVDTKIDTIDGIVDAILVDTGTTLQGELDGIQADTEDLQVQIGIAGAGLTAVPWNATWDTEVQSECTDALNAYDPPTRTELTSDISSLNDPTAAAIADAVWDEATTGHTTAGTFGEQASTDIDAILADTNELQTDDYPSDLAAISSALSTVSDYVDTEVAAILSLLDDTRGEPGQGAPPVNPDLATKIDYLYKAWRNQKTQTSTTWSLFDDAGTTVDQKATVSDSGGTATFGEIGSGP